MSKKKNKRPKGKANNGNKSKKNQTGGGAPQRRNKTKKHELSADEYTIAQRELEQQLKGIRLYCKDIAGDGNCLFGSLSDQFYGHTKFHSKIRKEICAYLEEKREHFQMFVEDDNTFDYHLSQMKKDGTYGGNMELVAFAQLHNLNIKIYQPNTIFVIRGNESKNIEDSDRIKTLHIAYHNWEHYSSVRKIDGPHEDLLPNSIEKMIMNSTGVNNLIKIRALMEKLDNDQDKVINKLFEEKQQKETDGGNDETNNKDDKGIVKGEVEIGNREDNLILTPKDYLQNDEELNSKASVLSDDKIEKKEEQEDDEECKDKDDLNNIVNDMVNDMVSVVMKDVVKDVVDVMKNDEAIDEKENDVVKNDEMEDDEMEDDMEKDRIESKMKIESSSERNHKSPQKKSSIDSLNSEKDGKSNEENKEISYNSQPKSRKEKLWKKLFYKSEFLVTKVFKTYKEQYQYHYITKGYDAVVTLPLFIFQKSCRDIRAIGGKESELVNGSIKLNPVCVMHKHIKFNVTNPISVQFSHSYFNYLIKFTRDLSSFENIKLYLSKNNSSLIEFKDDSS
ncbi:10837_t:CDS:10, partial [Entrophospora sp. SA101]